MKHTIGIDLGVASVSRRGVALGSTMNGNRRVCSTPEGLPKPSRTPCTTPAIGSASIWGSRARPWLRSSLTSPPNEPASRTRSTV